VNAQVRKKTFDIDHDTINNDIVETISNEDIDRHFGKKLTELHTAKFSRPMSNLRTHIKNHCGMINKTR